MPRSRALRLAAFGTAALAAAAASAHAQAPPTATAPDAGPPPAAHPTGTDVTGRVLRVDSPTGITVRVKGRAVRVTLAGVGDPGGKDPRAVCLRENATQYLEGRLRRGKAVTVRSRAAVRKGAVTGWVYLGTNTGAGSVNRALVMSGLAPVSGTVGRAQYAQAMRAAETRARHRKAGRWGRACGLSTTAGVQRRLASLGYLPAGAVNGVYDYRTQQAVMAFQGWVGLSRDGVLGTTTRTRLAGAQRPQPWRRSKGRYLEVHIRQQVLLLVENGKVKRAIHVSSGGATPNGSFSIIRRERYSWSHPFSVTLPYAQYFHGGFAFHEYPHVPGYPASHGCVRLPSPEAPVVWDFGAYGMPVAVR